MSWWEKHPNELPDIETLNDILLDIKDTDDYISGNVLLSIHPSPNVSNYAESKRVFVCDIDKSDFEPIHYYQDEVAHGLSTIKTKTTEYQVTKSYINLIIQLHNVPFETRTLVCETIQRVKEFITDDNLISVESNNHAYKSDINLLMSIYESELINL